MGNHSSLEYWSRTLYQKKYEYLTDAQAVVVWEAMKHFLLQWQEEMETIAKED